VTAARVVLLATFLPVAVASAQVATSDDPLARLRAAQRARPDDPQLALDLGLLLYQRDNASREAQRLLEQASTRFPKRRDVSLVLLDSYLAVGDAAATTALLGRLEPELAADERFALDTAYCLLGRRRFPEARVQWGRVAERVQASFRAASGKTLTPAADAELKRRVAEVLFVQGLLTARLGPKDEALRLLGQADGYGFPPLDSPLMMLAADCLLELQEPKLAAQAYREIVKSSPRNAEARMRLGVSLFASGQLAAAREQLDQVLRQDPDYPQAHYHLATVLLAQQNNAEAQAHIERELRRDARCLPCMVKLAHLSFLKGDDRLCESWLGKASALDPDDLEASLVSGMLENRTGRYEQAIRHLTRVVERSPGHTKAQYQLALAYERSRNAEKAREHREIYNKLIQEEKARTIGVRGSQD
jgi:tetratricopeptide (TPR) repeat protein